MRKMIGIFAALMLALGLSGVAFAHWSETLYIDGTINTGILDVEWSEEGSWDTDDYTDYGQLISPDKNVSSITCEIDDENPNLLHVTVSNAYPCIDYYNLVDIHNTGTIPVHVLDVDLDNPNPDEVQIWITYYSDPECQNPISPPVQLHPCDTMYVLIHVHLTQEALEDHTYTFDAEIEAVQWNYG